MIQTYDLRVREVQRLITPRTLKNLLPATEASSATVIKGREEVMRILQKEDHRLLIIVGPCSIHDQKSAMEYATKLAKLRQELSEHLAIVMRVYYEKPRTTIGWKGLINDPMLDSSNDIDAGLKLARNILLDITAMGLPTATELLDPIIPQYIDDLISWTAIGARTTESQTHREMASGLSMPVGFKNSTDGSLQVAIDAIQSSMSAHSFLGIDPDGITSVIRTAGNPYCHVVLRGGRARPNYDAESIRAAETQLEKAKLPKTIMVDCSHANSSKQFSRQELVWRDIISQRASGTESIVGSMIESHLFEGSQPFPQKMSQLKYGISVTDPCIGWGNNGTNSPGGLRYSIQ